MSTEAKTALLKLGEQEISIPDAIARDNGLLEEAYPGVTTDPARGIFRETVGATLVVHVYSQAVIQAEGQTIPVQPAVASDDGKVRDALALLFGFGAALEITRKMVGQRLVVSVVKRAGPKGSAGGVIERLAAADQEWNPALLLEWELTVRDAADRLDVASLLEMQPRIEAAIKEGERWRAQVAAARRFLGHAQAVPASVIASGF
jgi:hypothetical protein